MSADGAPPEDARVEALRSKFPWLSAGATLAADPDVVEAAPPAHRRCGGCGGTTHDRRNCPMGQRIPKRCAWCRAIGHTARSCPERPADVAPDMASLRARANMCRRCREIGHAMSACPQRPDGTKHCSYCHEAHHQVTTCAKYRADHPEAPPFRRGAVVRHCGRCGEPGHHAPTCPLDVGDTDLVDLVPAPVVADVEPPITTKSIAAKLPPIGPAAARETPAVPVSPPQVRAENESRAPARRCCSVCRQPGHRIERCPQRTGEVLHKPGTPLVWRPESARPPRLVVDRDPEADLTDLVPEEAVPICTEVAVSVQDDLPPAPPEVCGRCQQEGHDARGCPMRTTSAKAFYRIRQNGNGRSESVLEMKRALRVVANDVELDDAALPARPRTRGDCVDGPRPCPWVSCRHHLYLDVTETGTIRYPSCEVDEMGETCALDVADRGGNTLEVVGSLLRVTRERIRQVETMAVQNAAVAAAEMGGMEAAPEHGESPLAAAMAE